MEGFCVLVSEADSHERGRIVKMKKKDAAELSDLMVLQHLLFAVCIKLPHLL